MEDKSLPNEDRQPYEPPAVVYEGPIEVTAGSQLT
jgi:hypothetical protein